MNTSGPPPATGQRAATVRALSWSAIATVGTTLLTLLRSAVLSRLLQPEQFGLFGLVNFALNAVGAFTDLGLNRAALITQHGDAGEQARFLDTAWTVQLIRGALLTVLVAALSVPYGLAMREPRLWPLLACGALSLVLSALASPATLLLYRELKQKALAVLKLSTAALGLAVAALAAWLRPSAWALVLGFVASAAAGAALSYAVHQFRPRLRLDRELLRRGFSQGRYVALAGAMTFVTTQVDNLIVGRVLGAAQLGLYLFAYRLASLPLEQLFSVIGAVALPGYVRTRAEGADALGRHAQRVISPATVLCGAILLPLVLLRRELTLVLGGARWLEAAALLPPLCLLCLLRGLTINLGTLLHAVERVDLDARGRLVEGIVFIGTCAGLVLQFGMAGAAWAGVITYALALALRTHSIAQVLPTQFAALTRCWGRPALAAILLGALGLVAERQGLPALIAGPVALAIFVAAAMRLDPELPAELRRLYLTKKKRALV